MQAIIAGFYVAGLRSSPRPEMPQRPKASAVDFPSGRQSRARASEAKSRGFSGFLAAGENAFRASGPLRKSLGMRRKDSKARNPWRMSESAA